MTFYFLETPFRCSHTLPSRSRLRYTPAPSGLAVNGWKSLKLFYSLYTLSFKDTWDSYDTNS